MEMGRFAAESRSTNVLQTLKRRSDQCSVHRFLTIDHLAESAPKQAAAKIRTETPMSQRCWTDDAIGSLRAADSRSGREENEESMLTDGVSRADVSRLPEKRWDRLSVV